MGAACSVHSAARGRAAGARRAGGVPAGSQPSPGAPAQAAVGTPWASESAGQATQEAAPVSPPFQDVRHPHQPVVERQAEPIDEAGDHEASERAVANDESQPVGEAARQEPRDIVFELTFDNREALSESHGELIEAELRQRLQRPFLSIDSGLFDMVGEKTWVMDSHGNKTGNEGLDWLSDRGSIFGFDEISDDAFPVTLHVVMQERQNDVDISRYTDGDIVFDALSKTADGYHPVRVLRMSWLLQMEETVLKRRQELPESAFVSAEELQGIWERGGRGGYDRALPLVTISFCWDSREHPDPMGKQLKLIVDTLKSEREKYSKCCGSFLGFDEVGVFWDWPFLLQGDPQKAEAAKQAALAEHRSEEEAEKAASEAKRTPGEKAAFSYALHETMDLWYAHQGTTVFLLTEHPRERGSHREQGYEESGWTTYERCSAEQIKRVFRYEAEWDAVLDLGSGSSGAKAAGRRWPVGPEEFDEMIETRSFTNGADRDAVKQLFRRMSKAQLGGVKILDFAGMPRAEPADMARLGGCLLLCRSLERLDLIDVQMGDEGLRALVAPLAAAPRAAGPPLPALKNLGLNINAIGDAGAAALAAALPAAPALESLSLGSNAIGDAGAEALAAAKAAAPGLEIDWIDW